MTLVSEDDINAYWEDGAVCLAGAFGADWLAVLAAGIQRNLDNPGWQSRVYTRDRGPAAGFFFGDAGVWRDIPEYEDFLFDSPAAGIAGALTGAAEINIFFDGCFVRAAHTPSRTPWHQDVPYWPIEGDHMCSIWVPLDPVPRAGSVEFVRGSHRWGKVYKPKSFFKSKEDYDFRGGGLEAMPEFEALGDRYDLIGWEMAPGDALCFHGHVIHGAAGNETGIERRTFQARFSGDGMTYALRDGEMHPTFPDCGLAHGDPIGGPAFPPVWRRGAGLLGRGAIPGGDEPGSSSSGKRRVGARAHARPA